MILGTERRVLLGCPASVRSKGKKPARNWTTSKQKIGEKEMEGNLCGSNAKASFAKDGRGRSARDIT